jgi:hypothetical protein
MANPVLVTLTVYCDYNAPFVSHQFYNVALHIMVIYRIAKVHSFKFFTIKVIGHWLGHYKLIDSLTVLGRAVDCFIGLILSPRYISGTGLFLILKTFSYLKF